MPTYDISGATTDGVFNIVSSRSGLAGWKSRRPKAPPVSALGASRKRGVTKTRGQVLHSSRNRWNRSTDELRQCKARQFDALTVCTKEADRTWTASRVGAPGGSQARQAPGVTDAHPALWAGLLPASFPVT